MCPCSRAPSACAMSTSSCSISPAARPRARSRCGWIAATSRCSPRATTACSPCFSSPATAPSTAPLTTVATIIRPDILTCGAAWKGLGPPVAGSPRGLSRSCRRGYRLRYAHARGWKRWPWPWCCCVAAMACSRLMPEAWTRRPPGQPLQIILESGMRAPDPFPNDLRDRRSVWQMVSTVSPGGMSCSLPWPVPGHGLTPSGATWSSSAQRWHQRPLESRDTPHAQERRKLQMAICGSWWTSSAFDGNALTLVVPMDLPPGHPEPP